MNQLTLRCLCTAFFLTLLHSAYSTTSFIAFSKHPHFLCNTPQNLCPTITTSAPHSTLTDLITHLTSNTPIHNNQLLPNLERTSPNNNAESLQKESPVIVVVGKLEEYDRQEMLQQISKVGGGGWGIGGVGAVEDTAITREVDGLKVWTETNFAGGPYTVRVDSVEDKKEVLKVVRKLGERGEKFSIVWTNREGDEKVEEDVESKSETALKDEEGDAKKSALKDEDTKKADTKDSTDTKKGEDEDTSKGTKDDKSSTEEKGETGKDVTDEDLEAKGGMIEPEISKDVFTSLLLVGLLLVIFIPGFLCLRNIQTPATFESLDEPNVIKKMQ